MGWDGGDSIGGLWLDMHRRANGQEMPEAWRESKVRLGYCEGE